MKPASLKTKEYFSKDPAQALEQLMESFGAIVMRTAYFYTGDRHLAEDISQEVFLRSYRKWASFRGDSTVKTWLTTITINVCRDKMGVRMFTEQPADTSRMERGRTISVEDEALRRLEKSEVLQHLLRLPLPYQEALYLYYYLDFSTREIAEATSSPEGTVRNRLYRAREALAREMNKEETTKTDMDHKLRQQLRKESDDLLFSPIELSDRLKQKIRQQAAVEKESRRFVFPKAWIMGMVAMVAAVMIIAGFPMLQQPSVPAPADNSVGSFPPSNGGVKGSELSLLITTTLNSVEEARAAFGPSLLVPNVVPEGFKLSEMVAVGMEGEPVRDVIFTYASGEKTVTFMASRNPVTFPVEMFTPTQVGGVDGFVFEQPEFTELFWVKGGIQYSITGQLSIDEAMKVAESVEE